MDTTVTFDQKALKLDHASDADEIIQAINNHIGTLKTLILSGNTLGIDAGKAIGDSLGSHNELTRALWSDMFTGRSKAIIAPALQNLSAGVILSGAKLTELDLRDNAFGPTGVVGVTDLLASSCCHTLKILRMDNEGLGHQGCKYVADALKKNLENSLKEGHKLQLEVFTAGRNRLENEGAKMLSEVFYQMKSLRELALYQNGIGIHGPDGCEALAKALAENKNLTILNLSDNSLTARGIKILGAKALPELENLQVLNVSDCILRTLGAQKLSEYLADTTPNLKELYVSGNEIRRHAAIELIISLQNKRESMTVLDLNCNELGEQGIADVHEAALSLELESCLQSMSDDEGCEDDEEDEEYEDDDDDEDEDEDSLEGDVNQEKTRIPAENFSFKTPDPNKGKSLFEGLNICSPNTGLGSLFKAPDTSGNRSGGLFSLHSAATGDPNAPITGRSLFGNTTGSQGAQSLFSSTNSPAKSNSAPKPAISNGSGGKPSLFSVTSGSEKSNTSAPNQILQPPKFVAPSPSTADPNKLIEEFLKTSAKPKEKGFESVAGISVNSLKQYFVKHPSDIESAIRRSMECFSLDINNSVSKSILTASWMANPSLTVNCVMVELDLIKGESRKKEALSTKQAEALLNQVKDAFMNRLIPAKEARLLSFILSRGPNRTKAVELRQKHKSDIDSLVDCIEQGVSELSI